MARDPTEDLGALPRRQKALRSGSSGPVAALPLAQRAVTPAAVLEAA